MADETTPEVPLVTKPEFVDPMPVEEDSEKRAREEVEQQNGNGEKKVKFEDEKPVEEQGLESSGDEKMEEDGKESKEVTIGPKTFGSSVEIFDYFYKLLHAWPANFNLNKYEHLLLLDLLKKGHSEFERKIGKGVKAFHVRNHP